MRDELSDGREMSSASLVLLPRCAGIDQCGGERGGTDADTGGGFPAHAGFVLGGFFARLGTFYFAHGFIVGRCFIIFTHAPKMNQSATKVNRQKSYNLSGEFTG